MSEVLELEAIEVNEFAPIIKHSGIAKAERYAALFAPFMITVKELSDKVSTLNKENPSAVDAKLARDIRLAMVKNRTATANKKDESKSALLSESNLIQNLHNVVINTSQLVEAELIAIEKHAEIKEAERVAKLKADRMELLAPFVEDANIFPLGTMSEDQFNTMLEGYKLSYQQRIDTEKKAEAERIFKEAAEKLEQERIRQENEMLKAEAEQREIQIAQERAKAEREALIESERIAKETAEKIAAIELVNKEARNKAAAEQAELNRLADIEADKIKAENEMLAAELKVKQESERLAAQKMEAEHKTKIAAERKAAKAPDKDKLKLAIALLPALLVEVKTEEAQKVADNISEKFIAFKRWATEQIETL